MCPITGEILLDPVVASDGHTYSRAAIAKWFEQNQTSPLTGVPLPNLQLLPNHAMRKAIEEAREKQPLAIEPGRLQIHEDQVLGEGSHGCVVAGELSLGPKRTVRVAVKMLPRMTQLEERQTFQRELRAHMLAARHCDGVCHLYGTCELRSSRMALVLKRYERSLRAEIAAASGPLNDTVVCRLARSLAKTLAQLAAAGIVCRDIKTDNILLDEYGEPVLADFGISVVLSTATRIVPTSIQGTFNYMAPEAFNDQAEGGIGPHTDVWALGCVIVEMLTGKMPWEGMPIQQIMMAVAMQFRVPTVPEGAPAADVLGRCFAKLPRDRPTAKQLAEAFALAAVPAPSPVIEDMTVLLKRENQMYRQQLDELMAEAQELKKNEQSANKLREDFQELQRVLEEKDRVLEETDQRLMLRERHEHTLELAQRMAEQEAITEEVTRVNSRLTQEISKLKRENVQLRREVWEGEKKEEEGVGLPGSWSPRPGAGRRDEDGVRTAEIVRADDGSVGVRFLRSGGATAGPFEVTSLVPQGAAERSGAVEVGDHFRAVNGRDVTALDDAAVAGLFRGAPGTTLTLLLCDGPASLHKRASEGTSRPGTPRPVELRVELPVASSPAVTGAGPLGSWSPRPGISRPAGRDHPFEGQGDQDRGFKGRGQGRGLQAGWKLGGLGGRGGGTGRVVRY